MLRHRPERAAEPFQGLAAHLDSRNSHADAEATEAPAELLRVPRRHGQDALADPHNPGPVNEPWFHSNLSRVSRLRPGSTEDDLAAASRAAPDTSCERKIRSLLSYPSRVMEFYMNIAI